MGARPRIPSSLSRTWHVSSLSSAGIPFELSLISDCPNETPILMLREDFMNNTQHWGHLFKVANINLTEIKSN